MMSTEATNIKVGDKSLCEVLNGLSAQLERLEAKVDSQQQENNAEPPFSDNTASTEAVTLQQGSGPNTSPLGSASPS